MTILLLLQVLLPVALGLWLSVHRTPSWVELAMAGAALVLLVMGLRLAGLWTALPGWLPWLYGFVGTLGIGLSLRRPPSRLLPRRAEWVAVLSLAAVATIGAWVAGQALAGRRLPHGPAVTLDWPLAGGRYLIANGGSTAAVSSHVETLDHRIPRRRLWWGQSYGVDIVALTPGGRTSSGWRPEDPARYAIFGTPVLAPCSGQVIAARDGSEDHRLPFTPDTPDAGNHVMLRCGGADVLLAHLRRGSVAVAAGDEVRTGQRLGEVGNSGSSDEPHLHIHAQRPGTAAAPFSGMPLPILFDGRMAVRNDRR